MTGEEFLEKVRKVNEIISIEYEVKGSEWEADNVTLIVVTDIETFRIWMGSPAVHKTKETFLKSVYTQYVAICLILNRFYELEGKEKEKRFNVGIELGMCDAINEVIHCIKAKNHIIVHQEYPPDMNIGIQENQ